MTTENYETPTLGQVLKMLGKSIFYSGSLEGNLVIYFGGLKIQSLYRPNYMVIPEEFYQLKVETFCANDIYISAPTLEIESLAINIIENVLADLHITKMWNHIQITKRLANMCEQTFSHVGSYFTMEKIDDYHNPEFLIEFYATLNDMIVEHGLSNIVLHTLETAKKVNGSKGNWYDMVGLMQKYEKEPQIKEIEEYLQKLHDIIQKPNV